MAYVWTLKSAAAVLNYSFSIFFYHLRNVGDFCFLYTYCMYDFEKRKDSDISAEALREKDLFEILCSCQLNGEQFIVLEKFFLIDQIAVINRICDFVDVGSFEVSVKEFHDWSYLAVFCSVELNFFVFFSVDCFVDVSLFHLELQHSAS